MGQLRADALDSE